MVYDDRALGDRISAWAVHNAAQLDVKYIIWWSQIFDPERGWRPYNGASPHQDHVHISVQEGRQA
jgi:hypothetical protein